jgi:hypothetical protein
MHRLLLALALVLPQPSTPSVVPVHADEMPVGTGPPPIPPVCVGNGIVGLRVQVVYARASSAPDRYADVLPFLREQAGVADAVFHESAAETGGDRRIRFVHEPLCGPVAVEHAVIVPGAVHLFERTKEALRALGHTRPDRLYMVFLDADVIACGIADFDADDRAGPVNTSNVGNRFGVVDAPCWDGAIAAHELMHNLGGVQPSAPNSTGTAHCTDEWDLMCYDDDLIGPVQVTTACADPAHQNRFDCNHDDYFHTDPPPGSYLDTRWNPADNLFLVRRS